MKMNHWGPTIIKHRIIAKNGVDKIVALMLLFASGVFTPAQLLSATQSKTRAQVVSQLPLHGTPVVSMFMEREHCRIYLYLQHGGNEELTAVDITNLKVPRLVEHRPAPKKAVALRADKLGEYTALETVEQAEVRPTPPLPAVTPKTLRLVDITDHHRPIAGQIFANVTATLGDPDYRRIFIASTDTLYILKEREKGACEAPSNRHATVVDSFRAGNKTRLAQRFNNQRAQNHVHFGFLDSSLTSLLLGPGVTPLSPS